MVEETKLAKEDDVSPELGLQMQEYVRMRRRSGKKNLPSHDSAFFDLLHHSFPAVKTLLLGDEAAFGRLYDDINKQEEARAHVAA